MEAKIKNILKKLPGLDCGDCGYSTCSGLAEKILEGKAVLKDCIILNLEKKVTLRINEKEVPLGGFVQDFIKKTTLGMISSLKKVEANPGDVIELRIKVKEDDL